MAKKKGYIKIDEAYFTGGSPLDPTVGAGSFDTRGITRGYKYSTLNFNHALEQPLKQKNDGSMVLHPGCRVNCVLDKDKDKRVNCVIMSIKRCDDGSGFIDSVIVLHQGSICTVSDLDTIVAQPIGNYIRTNESVELQIKKAVISNKLIGRKNFQFIHEGKNYLATKSKGNTVVIELNKKGFATSFNTLQSLDDENLIDTLHEKVL